MKAKHRYTADDDDELSFDSDEVISVIPFNNTDEQARNLYTLIRVTACMENLEMSRNLTAVSEMSWNLLKVREVSGKKSCQGKH